MHIHPNLISPNTELNSLYAAQKSAAKREVERTRKKLLGFGYEVEAEASEACVVDLNAEPESRQERHPRQRGSGKKVAEQDAGPGHNSVSDWA
jgi:hypothetical protein